MRDVDVNRGVRSSSLGPSTASGSTRFFGWGRSPGSRERGGALCCRAPPDPRSQPNGFRRRRYELKAYRKAVFGVRTLRTITSFALVAYPSQNDRMIGRPRVTPDGLSLSRRDWLHVGRSKTARQHFAASFVFFEKKANETSQTKHWSGASPVRHPCIRGGVRTRSCSNYARPRGGGRSRHQRFRPHRGM